MGVLQDLTVTKPGPPDPTHRKTDHDHGARIAAAPMTAGAPAASTAFMRMFDGSFHDPVLDHTGFLTIWGDAFDLGMVGHWRPVLQRSVRRARSELT